MGIKQGGRLLLLAMLVWLPASCMQGTDNSPTRNSSSRLQPVRNPHLDLAAILPEDWKHLNTYRLDTNRDGKEEWVVLYCFDLLDRTDTHGAPIAAAVYQLDNNRPPNIIAHKLPPQNGDYLCECTCIPRLENVLSGLEGLELVVRDQCGEDITRLAIFHWDMDHQTYLPKGHFSGSRVEVTRDKVIVEQRLPGRAQLMKIETYYPDENQTYYRPDDRRIPLECTEEELRFCYGEPEDVLCSRYPEKVVLGFYNQYNDDEKASTYFTEKVRDRLRQCDASECGCIAPRHEIARARVTYLQLESGGGAQDPDWAIVGVTVNCERRDGVKEGERYMRWRLVREGECWKLERPE